MRQLISITFIIAMVVGSAHAQQGVGVDVSNPLEKLDVNGAIKVRTDINNAPTLPAGGAGTIRFRSGVFEGWDGTQWLTFGAGDLDWTVVGNNQYSAVSGNVGIGTNSPNTKLHIFSPTNPLVTIESDAGASLLLDRGTTSNDAVTQYLTNGTTKWIAGMDNQPSANASDFAIKTTNNGAAEFLITSTGKVGIGTTAPGDELHVEGSIRMTDGNQQAGYLPVSDANGTMVWTDPTTIVTSDDGDWIMLGNDLYNANSGNVGVGTSNPLSALHVSANSTSAQLLVNPVAPNSQDAAVEIRGARNNSASTNPSSLVFSNYDNDLSSTNVFGAIASKVTNPSGNFGDLLFLNSADGSTLTETMRLKRNGAIGIGTTNPSSSLEISKPFAEITVSDNNDNSAIHLTAPGSTYTGGVGTSTNHDLPLFTNGVDRVIIKTDGNMIINANGVSGVGLTLRDGYAGRYHQGLNVYDHSGNGAGVADGLTVSGYDGISFITEKTDATYGNIRMLISQSGKVGIGTTLPLDELHVDGSIRMVDGNQLAGRIPVSDANGTMTWTDPSTISLDDWTVNGNDIYNANSGKVGIGDITPKWPITVSTTNALFSSPNIIDPDLYALTVSRANSTNDQGVGIGLGSSGSGDHAGAGIVFKKTGVNSLGDLMFTVKSDNTSFGPHVPAVTIQSISGNVGIGTASPFGKLHVFSNTNPNVTIESNAGATLIVDRGTTTSEAVTQFRSDGFIRWVVGMDNLPSGNANDFAIKTTNNGSPEFLLTSAGNLGVGTASPTSKLHVVDDFSNAGEFTATIENTGNGAYSNGLEIKAGQNTQSVNNRFISFVKPNGTEIGAVRQVTSSSVDYNTTSDERLKTNIAPTAKGLNDLMQIQVKDYVYKEDLEKPQTGFIAQQVYDIYPNAVSVGGNDSKTDPWMMDYGKMTPLLVKAVQDLTKLVEEQQKRIEELEALR